MVEISTCPEISPAPVKWSRVAGVARYRVDVLEGGGRVVRRTVSATELRLKRVPAARLRVGVRAISLQGALSRPRAAKVRAARS